MNTARKPRLTDQLLADLDVAAQVLADEADYLVGAVQQHGSNVALQDRLAAKHRAVQRSHDWLTRHVGAVRAQRAAGEDQEDDAGLLPGEN